MPNQPVTEALLAIVRTLVNFSPRFRIALHEDSNTRIANDRAGEFLKLDEHRCGRDFLAYERLLAKGHKLNTVITDMGGLFLLVLHNYPEAYEAIKPRVIALGALIEYGDFQDEWKAIWG